MSSILFVELCTQVEAGDTTLTLSKRFSAQTFLSLVFLLKPVFFRYLLAALQSPLVKLVVVFPFPKQSVAGSTSHTVSFFAAAWLIIIAFSLLTTFLVWQLLYLSRRCDFQAPFVFGV